MMLQLPGKPEGHADSGKGWQGGEPGSCGSLGRTGSSGSQETPERETSVMGAGWSLPQRTNS